MIKLHFNPKKFSQGKKKTATAHSYACANYQIVGRLATLLFIYLGLSGAYTGWFQSWDDKLLNWTKVSSHEVDTRVATSAQVSVVNTMRWSDGHNKASRAQGGGSFILKKLLHQRGLR